MTGVLMALAFIAGVALGFTLGVAAYASIYALFMRWQEERARQRILRAEQAATRRAQEMAVMRAKMRSLYGARLDGDETQITEEMEKVLSAGPK